MVLPFLFKDKKGSKLTSDVQYISYIVIIDIIFHIVIMIYHFHISIYRHIVIYPIYRYNHVHNVMFTSLNRAIIGVCTWQTLATYVVL